MNDFSNDSDFQDLIAAWHENREFPAARREELQKRLDADPELRRALAREAQTAALVRTMQQGESRWLKLEERDESSGLGLTSFRITAAIGN